MTSDRANVRHAAREDVPTILILIRGLAAYEGLSSSVTASEELLTETLSFADPSSPSGWSPGYAKALLTIAPDGCAAGLAFYFYNYSTFAAAPGVYLDDIYVRPKFRRRGYGQSMMSVLAIEVLIIGGERLDCACLTWNEQGFAFLKSFGARDSSAWLALRLDEEHLQKFAKGDNRAGT